LRRFHKKLLFELKLRGLNSYWITELLDDANGTGKPVFANHKLC
jgi:hypothetical protein